MEFELQRFDDAEPQAESTEPSPESQAEERPLPEELNGLPEDIARETLAEWEQSQAETEPPESEEPAPAQEPPITREQYQAAIDEAKQLKEQLAAFQRQQQAQQQQPQAQAQQPQQQQPPPQQQQQQLRFTPEVSAKLDAAITAEAMALANMNADDVESLKYADEDDPRLVRWNQAKTFATSKVFGAIQQMQLAQQQQAAQFLASHREAINFYNEFAQKEASEPDYQDIVKFATNEFFEQLPPNEQRIIANSYVRVERQLAAPAEMLAVKNYYERAKAAFRTRNAKARPAGNSPRPAPQLPRSDQIQGNATLSDGKLTNRDVEELLKGDFTKIDEKTQKILCGLTA